MASQLLQKAGLVGEFSPTTVVPSPPKKTGPRQVGDFSPTDISHSFAYGWRFFSAAAARFLFGFSPFSLWKRSYFEVLIKFKKIGHTICDPYQIFKKIFSLRHHGVKSFWTKVGDFSPMPRLLGLRIPRARSDRFIFFFQSNWLNYLKG